jgi:hypothetical protein
MTGQQQGLAGLRVLLTSAFSTLEGVWLDAGTYQVPLSQGVVSVRSLLMSTFTL